MATTTEENYLKALFALSAQTGTVATSELSRSLGVSTPSVNSMVRKLAERGLVHYEKYRPLELTEAGRKAAALIIRKHRLTEMFLVDKMGFGWEEVHAIAEQIEHVESPAFFSRMDELMGYPTVDPHGSPIPAPDGSIATKPRRRLADCKIGETVTIQGLAHSSNEFLHFLNARSIGLQTRLTVEQVEAFDRSMVVSYRDKSEVSLSGKVTEQLLVS